MLALRSNGININELQFRFGNAWLENKSNYFSELQQHNLLTISKDNIKLTKNGYAVCDEILSNIL